MITEVPVFTTEPNPKIEYRMLIFSNMTRKKGESSYDDLMVLSGKKEAATKDQIELIKTKDVFEIFKKNGITSKTIDVFIKKFGVCIDSEKINILKQYVNEKQLNDFNSACELLMFTIKKLPFGPCSHKFAILSFNAILFRCNILPIIFYTYPALKLFELIESGLTLECLKDIVLQMFEKSIEYNTAHRLITINDIQEQFEKNKLLLSEKFDVEEAYITGSFANGLANKYSDLDLIVKTAHYENLPEIEEFLTSILGLHVDCIRHDDPFTQYEDLVKYRMRVI